MIIYKVTNIIDGKIYIGKTKHDSISNRIRCHKTAKKPSMRLHQAIRKDGFDNFKFEIIAKVSDKQRLDALEKFFISINNSINEEKGYNSYLGFEKTEKAKKLISLANSGNKYCVGRKQSEESLAKTRKKIVCSNGNTYAGIGVAAKELGLQRGNISSVLTGKLPHTGNLKFKYFEVV
jgi:group I intron endonuclease